MKESQSLESINTVKQIGQHSPKERPQPRRRLGIEERAVVFVDQTCAIINPASYLLSASLKNDIELATSLLCKVSDAFFSELCL